ncbi:MAG: DUF58 domain-containing protein, partial [Candidatus Bathyarchaeota archaeon]|nr:DUF58 domain-containing protein [Candidatus Bathyarchaeota archaeon]
MKTRLNFWILIFIFVLLLTALLLRNWKILAMTIPLMTFLALSNLLISRGQNIAVKRTLESELVNEEGELRVRLLVENKGSRLDSLELYDQIPRDTRVVSGSNRMILKLKANEKKELEYTLRCEKIGDYVIGPVLARSSDFMDTYEEDSSHPVYSYFSVIPYLEEIKRVKISPKRTRLWLGNILSRRIGLGNEFYSLGEYHSGDDMRRINWKASSRYDKLFVNDFEAEKSGDVIIMLDARQDGFKSASSPKNILYYEIKAALSIAARTLQERNRVGLVVQRDVVDWLYLGSGRTHFYKILHTLLSTKPSGTLPFEFTAWVVKKCFPPQTQIIMISPLADRSLVDYVVQLRAFGYDVLVISPSTMEIEKRLVPKDAFSETASRILRLDRNNNISELRQFASVVDWNVEEPLVQTLRSVRTYRPPRA